MVSVAPAELVTPWWRRARYWFAFAAVALVAALAAGSLVDSPGRRLDPTSPAKDGAKALARLLAGDGVSVAPTTSLATARAAAATPAAGVLVAEPDAYSADQLRSLRGVTRLVLLGPSSALARAVLPDVTTVAGAAESSPGCALPAATAAGDVEWPADTLAYPGGAGTQCYGGAVVVRGGIVLVGSADAFVNDNVADAGAAALGVNLLSADRTASRLTWLLPGADAAGGDSRSIWDLFPDGAYRVFWWLVGISVLLVLWRMRRLGAVVAEPLPVVVRAAELVEGHGRLYRRAGARDRAAAALRSAARRQLVARLGLSRRASAQQVATAAALRADRAPVEVTALLAGPPPTDDAGLVRLADDLDMLVAAAGGRRASE